MKYITSALVLIALMGESNAVTLQQKSATGFTDDLIKSLTEDMEKDANAEEPVKEEKKPESKKPDAKKDEKKADKKD